MMVDMLGFHLEDNTPDFISPEEFNEITEWVAGVMFVGEFETDDVATIKLKTQQYNIHFVETTQFDQLEPLKELDKPLIYKHRVTNAEMLANMNNVLSAAADLVEFSIIEVTDPSFYEQVDQLVSNTDFPLVKGYNVTESSVADLAAFWKGIQLVGTPEDQPGFKDYGEVMDVLEQLEED
jgi:phosphoribosylanthranilate isomerase